MRNDHSDIVMDIRHLKLLLCVLLSYFFPKLAQSFFSKLAHMACNENNILNFMVPGEISFHKFSLETMQINLLHL